MPMRTTRSSNIAQIHKKLSIAFDDSALSAFCLAYFTAVYDNFSEGMRKDNKMTLLLDHCRRRPNGFKSLLDSVREEYQMSNSQREELLPLINILEGYTSRLRAPSGLTLPHNSQKDMRSSVKIHNFTVNILVVDDLYILQSESDLVGQTAPVILNPDTIWELAYTPAKYKRSGLEQMTNLGKEIYNQLLPEDVRTNFQQAKAIVKKQNSRLRLLLKFAQSDLLHQIPWELMHDGDRAIALDPVTLIVRYIEQPKPVKSLYVKKPPLRVLLTTACPQGVDRLELEREEEVLRSALKPYGKSIQLEVRKNVSFTLLRHALIRAQERDRPFHIWHHCGHGTMDPVMTRFALLLEEQGEIENAWSEEIIAIIKECPMLRLAIFNLCYSGSFTALAPGLATINVPATIGFRQMIDDAVALDFMRALYGNLLRQTVDVALKNATRALFDSLRPLDSALPLCFLRTTNASLLR